MEGKYPIMIDDALAGTLEVTKKGAMTVFDARCKGTDELLRLSVYGDDGEGYLGVMVPEGGEMRLRRSLSPLSMRGFPEMIVAAGPAGRGNAGQQGVVEEAAAPRSDGDAPATEEMGGGEKREATPPHSGSGKKTTDRAENPETAPPERPREECSGAAPCKADCGEAVSPAPPETGGTPGAEEIETPREKCPEPEGAEPPCEKPPAPAGGQSGQEAPAAPPETENAPGNAEDLCWYASPDGALVCFDGVHSLIALPLKDERVPENVPGQPRRIEGREYLVYVTKNGRIVS